MCTIQNKKYLQQLLLLKNHISNQSFIIISMKFNNKKYSILAFPLKEYFNKSFNLIKNKNTLSVHLLYSPQETTAKKDENISLHKVEK